MKILVTYSSQTGNTEKIASAIYEEASLKNEAVLIRYDDVDLESIPEYDVVFIGSPIHAGDLSKETKNLLSELPVMTGKSLAGFITHASTAYPQQDLDQMMQPYKQACRDKGMEYKGCFNCQGYLADFMHDAVQKMKNVDDAQWAEMKKRMTGHPSVEDEANARAFTKLILA